MSRDPWRSDRPQPIDDATIEQLVREVAGGWTMPPVRLDAPSWRDRIRAPRVRRLDALRGWGSRLGRAASGAVALTVVAALVAVMLTRGPATPGNSTEPSDGHPSPGASGAAFTPLPKHLVLGEMPAPSTVLTEIEEGDFALVDLRNGERSAALTGASYGSVMRRMSDGSLACLCVKLASNVFTRPTRAEITLARFDADGALLSSVHLLDLAGEPDPRDGVIDERPPHLTFDVQLSADERFAIIGWSVRKHPVWHSGITIFDLSDGATVSQLDLPDASDGEGQTRRVVMAPRLLDPNDDGDVVLAREWYSWSPPESQGQNFQQGTETSSASLVGGVLADAAPLDGADGCGERVLRGGSAGSGTTWLVCTRAAANQLVVRRLDAGGKSNGDTTATAATGVDGDTVALSGDGRIMFLWNPTTAQLARIDLVSGEKAISDPVVATVQRGPLAALGAWLAPSAAAKTFLYGGIVVSPDGTRVYAIGIHQGPDGHEMAGSAGIFVFDAASLASLGHWDPSADYISIGISGDGKSVYASGLPRFDAAGNERPSQQASITVHDADSGAVEVVAGELGGKFLQFSDPVQD